MAEQIRIGTRQGLLGGSHDLDLGVGTGAGVHHDIQQFFLREAWLLDHQRYLEWTALLARDLVYRTPIRCKFSPDGPQPAGKGHIEDDYGSICTRVRALLDPPARGTSVAATRTQRFVTNVIVCAA